MIENEFYSVATDEEMKEVREKGKRIKSVDDNIEVTAYLYNDRIYIDDVKQRTDNTNQG